MPFAISFYDPAPFRTAGGIIKIDGLREGVGQICTLFITKVDKNQAGPLKMLKFQHF